LTHTPHYFDFIPTKVTLQTFLTKQKMFY